MPFSLAHLLAIIFLSLKQKQRTTAPASFRLFFKRFDPPRMYVFWHEKNERPEEPPLLPYCPPFLGLSVCASVGQTRVLLLK